MRGDVTGNATDGDLAFGVLKPMGTYAQNRRKIASPRARIATPAAHGIQTIGHTGKSGLSGHRTELGRKKLSA